MVTMYGNGCPKCRVLEMKLKQKGIEFTEVNDMDVMIEKGFMQMPMLVLEDMTVLNFEKAVEWVNEQ